MAHKAVFMIEKEFYNGVNFIDSAWDGTVSSAIGQHNERIQNFAEEYKERNTVTDDWIVVTVDYHT